MCKHSASELHSLSRVGAVVFVFETEPKLAWNSLCNSIWWQALLFCFSFPGVDISGVGVP